MLLQWTTVIIYWQKDRHTSSPHYSPRWTREAVWQICVASLRLSLMISDDIFRNYSRLLLLVYPLHAQIKRERVCTAVHHQTPRWAALDWIGLDWSGRTAGGVLGLKDLETLSCCSFFSYISFILTVHRLTRAYRGTQLFFNYLFHVPSVLLPSN